MKAHHVFRTLKWAYFAVLIAATGIGVWAAYPVIKEQRTKQQSPLSIHVYSQPFTSVFSDTTLGARTSASLDTFFGPEVVGDAMTQIMQRHPAPFAKDADRDAWSRDFASDLTAELNNYMARHYRDSLERLEISAQARSQVLVRIENVSKESVDDVRLEVTGGQLFMEGPPTPKLRSLGTRAMRLPTIAPGEKTELFVLTTQEMAPGGAGPNVQVSSKGQAFPIVRHAADISGPSVTTVRWIASGALYLVLISLGLGVKARSLAGQRARGPAPVRPSAPPVQAPVAASPAPASEPAAPQPVNPAAWRRPDSA